MVVVAAAADVALKTAFVDAAVVVVAGVNSFRITTFFSFVFRPRHSRGPWHFFLNFPMRMPINPANVEG